MDHGSLPKSQRRMRSSQSKFIGGGPHAQIFLSFSPWLASYSVSVASRKAVSQRPLNSASSLLRRSFSSKNWCSPTSLVVFFLQVSLNFSSRSSPMASYLDGKETKKMNLKSFPRTFSSSGFSSPSYLRTRCATRSMNTRTPVPAANAM